MPWKYSIDKEALLERAVVEPIAMEATSSQWLLLVVEHRSVGIAARQVISLLNAVHPAPITSTSQPTVQAVAAAVVTATVNKPWCVKNVDYEDTSAIDASVWLLMLLNDQQDGVLQLDIVLVVVPLVSKDMQHWTLMILIATDMS